jgi:EpsI family protein
MLFGGTRLVLLTALIGTTAVMASRLPTVQTEARAKRLLASRLPMRLGQWSGTVVAVPADVQKALPTADILSRRYRDPMGSADVTLISGSDATVLHDPHDCLRGDGWQFLTDQARTVELPGRPGGPITVRDVVMQHGLARAHMWYWYSIGSEIFDSTLPARLGMFRIRLTEGKGPRAEFVRLIVDGETDSERSTLMLSDLARHVAGR